MLAEPDPILARPSRSTLFDLSHMSGIGALRQRQNRPLAQGDRRGLGSLCVFVLLWLSHCVIARMAKACCTALERSPTLNGFCRNALPRSRMSRRAALSSV